MILNSFNQILKPLLFEIGVLTFIYTDQYFDKVILKLENLINKIKSQIELSSKAEQYLLSIATEKKYSKRHYFNT